MSGVIWTAIVVGLVAALAWLCRCRHPRESLSLLPSVTTLDGRTLPARWACWHCRREWPAGFVAERTTRPIQRFSGHDESKAVNAAARAAALELETRTRAVIRSGVAPVVKRSSPPGQVSKIRRFNR